MIFDSLLSKAFTKAMGRGDGLPSLAYFPLSYFGVSSEPFSFLSEGRVLRGERCLPAGDPKAVIVFFHGLGAGYTAYSPEIAAMAKAGYLVYCFDYCGCMQSEGSSMIDLGHPILDIKAFFSFLDGEDIARGKPRFALGHSWGGYMALHSLHEENYGISRSVSLAGFIDLALIVEHSAPSMSKLDGALRRYFRKRYGKAAGESASIFLKEATGKRLLYIASPSDDMVPYKDNFVPLRDSLEGKEGFEFISLPNKGHQPYWSDDAVAYFHDIMAKGRPSHLDRDTSVDIDFARLQQDDEKVMKTIIDFFSRG